MEDISRTNKRRPANECESPFRVFGGFQGSRALGLTQTRRQRQFTFQRVAFLSRMHRSQYARPH